MPRVSKKKLNNKVFLKMSDEFVEVLASLGSKNRTRAFLADFLTESERVMLAKRLAILVMRARGYSLTDIEATLKVSPTTIIKIWRSSQNKECVKIVEKLAKSHERQDFIREIEEMLGLPPYGKGRWRYINKHRRK